MPRRKSKLAPGGARRVLRLVVLDHHPPGARPPAGLPEVAPVEHAGADVGPAVLVLVLPGWRDVLDVRRGQPAAVALEPGLGVDAAAHQPGDVGLPGERAAACRLEEQLERGPVAVLVASAPSDGCDSRARCPWRRSRSAIWPSSWPSGAPAVGRHLALLRRHRRHEQLVALRASGRRRPWHRAARAAPRGRRGWTRRRARARRAWPASRRRRRDGRRPSRRGGSRRRRPHPGCGRDRPASASCRAGSTARPRLPWQFPSRRGVRAARRRARTARSAAGRG